jgi:hypothetical protein
MANRYWVLGNGAWSTIATGNWSATSGGAGGASVPTAADSVFFDQAGTYSVTMTGALTCLDITVSAGTVSFATGTTPTLTVSGSMSLAAGTSWFNGLTTFNSSATGRTITTNGTNLSGGGVTFANVAGGWTLGSSLTFNALLTLTSGALNLNGFDITCYQFNANNSNVRSIAFGANNIFLVIPSGGITVLNINTITNFTCTGTGGFIADAAVTRTYNVGVTGATSTNVPKLTLTGSGTAIATFTNNSTFGHLDFGTTAFTVAVTTVNVNSLTLSSAASAVYTNLTVSSIGTGTITTNGKSIFGLVMRSGSYGAGTTTFVGNTAIAGSNGTLTLNNGTINNLGTISCGIIQVVSNFTLGSTAGTITANFNSSSSYLQLTAGSTLNYNGGTLLVPSILHDAGTLSLGQSLTSTSTTSGYNFTTGTIQLNGYNLTCGEFVASGTAANTRSIAFGTGNIILNTTTVGRTVLSLPDVTNFTWTGTGGFVSDAAVTRTYTFGTTGGTAAKAINLSINSGSAVPTITSSSWFKTLNFNGSSTTPALAAGGVFFVDTLILSSGGTYTNLLPIFTRAQTLSAQFGKVLVGFGFYFLNSADTLLLDGTQTFTTNSICYVVQGVLDLGGYDLSVGAVGQWFSGDVPYTIAFGSNNIILTTTNVASNALTLGYGLLATFTGTGEFLSTAAVNKAFAFGTISVGTNPSNWPKLRFTGSGTAVQAITAGSTFNKIDFGTTVFDAGTTNVNFANLILSPSGTYSTFQPTFTGSGTFTPNGNATLASLTVNGVGITTTLGGTFSTTATGTVTLTAGTLALNGYNITTGIFSSSGNGVREVAFGSNYIYLVHTTAATTVLSMANAGGEGASTFSGTGGFSTSMSVTRTVTYGSSNFSYACYVGPNLFVTGGASALTITDNAAFTTLDLTGSTCTVTGQVFVDTLTLATGGTYTSLRPLFTRTQTWTAQFSKQLNGIGVSQVTTAATGPTLTLDGTQTYTATSIFRLMAGNLDLGGFDLTIGTFTSTVAATRSIAFGSNNIILATTTAAAINLEFTTASFFTYTGTGGFRAAADITRTFTFGTTGGTAANAPNLTFTGSGTAIQTVSNASWFNHINFGTTAFTPTSASLNVNSLTLSSGGTFTGLTITTVGTGTLTTNNKALGVLTINCPSGTTTLGGAVTFGLATATTTLTAGTLALNGYDITTGIFSSSNSNVRAIAFGIKKITLATTTAAAINLSMANATNFSCSGTGKFEAAPDITRTFTVGTSGAPTIAPSLFSLGANTAVQTFTTGSYFGDLLIGGTFTVPTTSLFVTGRFFANGGTTVSAVNLTMIGTAGIVEINSTNIASLTINNSGTTTLMSTTNVVTGATTLTSGTLDLNGKNFTTATFVSTNTNVRSIAFGASDITLNSGTAAATVLSMADATNFTWTGTGAFTTVASTTRTLRFGSSAGGTSTNAPNVTISSGASVITLTTGSWFNTLNFGTSSFTTPATTVNVNSLFLSSTGAYTTLNVNMIGTGTVTSNAEVIAALNINSSGITTLAGPLSCTVCTLNSGTFNLNTYTLTCSGATFYNGGTLTNAGGISCTTFQVQADFELTQGTITASTNFALFSGSFTYTGGTLNTPGVTQTSGFVLLSQALSFTGVYTLTAGTLTLNGVNLTVGTFSSSNSNVRTINFGSNYIVTATTTAAATNVSMSTITNATFIGAGGFSANMSTTRTFTVNTGTTVIPSLSPNLFLTGGTSTATITNTSTFNMLSATGGAFSVDTSVASGDVFCRSVVAGPSVDWGNLITVQIREAGGTISSLNTTTLTNRGLWKLTIYHIYGSVGSTSLLSDSYIGWRASTLSSLIMQLGTLDLNGFNLYPVTVVSNENSGVLRSIIYGSNFIYPRPLATVAAAFDVSDPQGFTHSGSGGISVSLTGQGAFSRNIINGSLSLATRAASIDECPNIFITGTTSTSDAFTIQGSFKTVDLGTNTCTQVTDRFGAVNFTASPNGTYTDVELTSIFASGTFDLKNKTFLDLSVEVPAGQTTTFGSNATFSASTGIDIVSGNINLNSYTLSIQSFASTGTGTRQILGTGTINCSVSWTVTTGAGFGGAGAYNINMTRATAKTFAGGGGSYGTLVQAGAGALTISGANTFTDIQATTRPSTITFTAGTTQTFNNFTLSGILGSNVTINSTTAGSQYTLYKASGTVGVNYLTIQDSNVTGSAYWGTTTSTFVSNNTGWNPTRSTGNFMAFF